MGSCSERCCSLPPSASLNKTHPPSHLCTKVLVRWDFTLSLQLNTQRNCCQHQSPNSRNPGRASVSFSASLQSLSPYSPGWPACSLGRTPNTKWWNGRLIWVGRNLEDSCSTWSQLREIPLQPGCGICIQAQEHPAPWAELRLVRRMWFF